MAAAGLIWEGPRLLLLRTTYKPNWALPGGCVEEGESPLQACLREVEEETGLIRTTGTLRCVDHRKPDDRVVGGLRFIFDLGACSPVRTSHFGCRLRKSSRLVTPDEACHLVDTAQARRLATVLKSLSEVIYLENGISPEPLGT